MISWDRQPARRTVMPAVSQPFRDGSPAGAVLRRATGVHLDTDSPSLCRFGEQDHQEHAPADIMHRFGQHAAGESLNIEVLDDDQSITVDQASRHLVMKIAPLVPHMCVDPLQGLDRFAAPVSTPFSASNLALRSSQLGLSCCEVARIVDPGAIRQGGERLQPDIEPHRFGAVGQRGGVTRHAEADVPAPGFPLERHGLDRALQGPVPLDFEFADALAVQLAIGPHAAAIAIRRQGEAVEPRAAFEPRIAGLFAGLHATKEGLEGLLDAAQHILAGGEIRQTQAAIGADRFELVGLIVVVEGDVRLAIGISTFLEGSVVQSPGLIKLGLQGFCLSARGIDFIAEGLAHGSSSLLRVDVPLNRGRRDVACRAHIVAPGPQAGQARAQVRKLLAQPVAACALHPVHHLTRGQGRRDFHEEVDMIRLHRDVEHLASELPDDLGNNCLQAFTHRSRQDRASILGAENEVVADFIRCMSGVCSFIHSKRIITHAVNEHKSWVTPGRASSLRLAPFPLPFENGSPQGA
jgi:hypothetical protein